MKILKNKEKFGFKGTIIKIGIAVLFAFMVFGALKSCIKVKAEISTLSVGDYTFDYDLKYSDLQHLSTHYQNLKIYSTTSNESWFTSQGLEFIGMQFKLSGDSSTGWIFELFYLSRIIVGVSYQEVPIRVYFNTNVPLSSINESTWVDEAWRDITITNASINYYYSGSLDTSYNFLPPILSITELNVQLEQAYKNGYEAGYSRGQTRGFLTGYNDANIEFNERRDSIYNEGYEAGLLDPENPYTQDAYEAGKEDGYALGLEAQNPYSFSSLIFSVFEVPVKTFVGLFNWNFLGVNLANFMLSLLTLSFIVVIVKRFI